MKFEKELLQYIRKERSFFPPYVWDKFGVSPEAFSRSLSSLYHLFPKACIVDDLYTIDPPNIQWVYEVCDTKYNRGTFIHESQLYGWCKANQKKDQHHSIVQHDEVWQNHVKTTGSTGRVQNSKVRINEIYLELDRKGSANPIQKAMDDAFIILMNPHIGAHSTVFFSGNSSIHIMIDGGLFGRPIGLQHKLCGRGKLIYNLQHAIVGDVRFRNGLVDVWNADANRIRAEYARYYTTPQTELHKMRQYLENTDPNICGVNSLIRAPFSWHEKGGKQKLTLTEGNLLAGETNGKIGTFPTPAKPYLLHLYYENLKPTYKQKKVACNASTSYITRLFTEYIDDFDENAANADGWVNGLYSPFYDDGNPSVGVNIHTGFYKDFGNPEHTFSFVEFLAKIKNISLTQAKQLVEHESNH